MSWRFGLSEFHVGESHEICHFPPRANDTPGFKFRRYWEVPSPASKAQVTWSVKCYAQETPEFRMIVEYHRCITRSSLSTSAEATALGRNGV